MPQSGYPAPLAPLGRHAPVLPAAVGVIVKDGLVLGSSASAAMAFSVISAARLPLLPISRERPPMPLQALHHAADRPVARPYGAFGAWLSPSVSR
jgi:hypothetical protein